MVNEQVLFHGGFGAAPPIWALTHFGTPSAALGRMHKKLENVSDAQRKKMQSEAFLVAIKFEQPQRVLCMDDIGSPRPEGLLRFALHAIAVERGRTEQDGNADYLDRHADTIQALKESWEAHSDQSNRMAIRNYVAQALSQHCDAISYINRQEDVGHRSWILLNEVAEPAVVGIWRGAEAFEAASRFIMESQNAPYTSSQLFLILRRFSSFWTALLAKVTSRLK
jgi:hypothetical protein